MSSICNGIGRVCGIFGLLVLLASCGATKDTASGKTDKKGDSEVLSPKDQISFKNLYFEAEKEKSIGNFEKASVNYQRALLLERNPAVLYELARLESAAGRSESALNYGKEAAKRDEQNPWYKRLLVGLYYNEGDVEAAQKELRKVIALEPFSEGDYNELVQIQLGQGEPEKAIATLNDLESKVGIREEISFQKQGIYLNMGEEAKAIAELEKLAEFYPTEATYKAALFEIYLQTNNLEKAKACLVVMEASDPNNGRTLMAKSQLLAQEGKETESFQAIKAAFYTPEVGIDEKVGVLLRFYSLSDHQPAAISQALELVKITEETNPNEAKTWSISGDLYLKNSQPDVAAVKYRKALALDGNRLAIWQQLINMQLQTNNFEALVKDTEEALELFPTQAEFYLYNGIGNNRLGNHEAAIESLSVGKEFVVENDFGLAQFYASLGQAHNSLKQYEKSDKAYEKSIKLDAENVLVMNNYSYYLSLRNTNLERAAELSEKSNTLAPNTASFQDTYGWILFQQGKFADAKTWLEKAIAAGAANDGTVLEHMGDVLYKLGDEASAVEHWKMAVDAGGGSDLLQKKTDEGKYYE